MCGECRAWWSFVRCSMETTLMKSFGSLNPDVSSTFQQYLPFLFNPGIIICPKLRWVQWAQKSITERLQCFEVSQALGWTSKSRFILTFHSKLKVQSIQHKDVSQQPFAASLLTQLHHQLEPPPFFGHLSTFLNANNRLEIHEARLFAQHSMHRRFVLQINWIKTEHNSKALLGEVKI